MLKPTKSIILALIISLIFSLIAGCENDAQTDALIGGALGAGIGALAGGDSKAIAIGAGAGGGIGYIVGNESDKKKSEAARKSEINDLRYQQNTETVWITNANGSKTSVKLIKSGPNYVGPNGEIYSSLPTEDQLRPVYGL